MKIERLIGIIMLLLQRELVSASEMATMFEVSKRTIFRDIDTLAMANIPIYTIAGTKGGIGIMPTYKVDKKLLTVDDLTAIIASLDGMEQLLSSAETKKTLQKMKNMLDHSSEPPKSSISLDFSNLSMKNELNAKVESLYLAIKKHQLVELSYIDRTGNQTIRKTEPYHLLFRNRSWYLQGYSLERSDFRTFKMSRIVELKTLEETFEARPFSVKPFGAPPDRPMFLMHEVNLKLTEDEEHATYNGKWHGFLTIGYKNKRAIVINFSYLCLANLINSRTISSLNGIRSFVVTRTIINCPVVCANLVIIWRISPFPVCSS